MLYFRAALGFCKQGKWMVELALSTFCPIKCIHLIHWPQLFLCRF